MIPFDESSSKLINKCPSIVLHLLACTSARVSDVLPCLKHPTDTSKANAEESKAVRCCQQLNRSLRMCNHIILFIASHTAERPRRAEGFMSLALMLMYNGKTHYFFMERRGSKVEQKKAAG